MIERNKIYQGDSLEVLRVFPDQSVHMCVTSPPYWSLRNYHADGQVGAEETPEEYVAKLVDVFREVKRVLRDDGSFWLNIGDCYATNGIYIGDYKKNHPDHQDLHVKNSDRYPDKLKGFRGGEYQIKAKDLIGIPWRVAFALQSDGWCLRNDIIWNKLNPMPSSQTDRLTSSFEHIFLFAKSGGNPVYWVHRDGFGARVKPAPDYVYANQLTGEEVREEPEDWKIATYLGMDKVEYRLWKRRNLWISHDYFFDQEAIKEPIVTKQHSKTIKFGGTKYPGVAGDNTYSGRDYVVTGKRNKRDVWTVSTANCREGHFAVYPSRLILPCIQAGTSEHGVCAGCGAPYERVVVKGDPDEAWKKQCGADSTGQYNGVGLKDYQANEVQNPSDVKRRILAGMVGKKTIGWSKTCSCQTDAVVPALVMDVFMGSGTTAVTALQHGRNFVGIDLNPDYIQIAEKNIANLRNSNLVVYQ